MKIALMYGTVTGKTEVALEIVGDALKPELDVPLVDVGTIEVEDLQGYDVLIMAIPTWDVGELEYNWAELVDEMDSIDLTGTRIFMIGLGDQENYPDTYQDAMGILYKKAIERGATGGLGFTSTEGHNYDSSLGEIDGKFCGLALDEENQEDLTEQRAEQWAAQVKQELGVMPASAT